MHDHYLDSEDIDVAFNQWLVSSSSIKLLSPIKLITPIDEESYQSKPLSLKKLKVDQYGNEIEDDGYRNPGGGSGRPRSTNPASKSISIRVTSSQHEKFLLLGGCKWIKKLIDEASALREA